ncbi:MAG TPA: tryptophan synthase subunit alpha [Blastocatellia bacterium]|nr:tryptophan synthase subunit alpha [Blastocatellia bacterium]
MKERQDRIAAAFRELAKRGRKAFIPFITAGDPDLETTEELILELERSGADIIELGVPFSDPMADGPVIQRASERALRNRVRIRDCLECIRRVRARSDVPIVLFSYFNPLLSLGSDSIADELKRADVDGVLVTDLVPEEAEEFIARMRDANIDTVFLVAPTSTDERIRLVAGVSRGFIYAVSRAGVTGVRENLSETASTLTARIRRFTDLPVAVGFGISTPEQVEAVWREADGAVVGSRIVAEIERLKGDPSLVQRVGELASSLVSLRPN